jgi:alkylation response protein AidB-like acyl-CoA dehydrogenase
MNLEHLLTKEELQIREAIREFTKKEIMPRAKELERDYRLVEEVHQKLVDIGVQSDGYPAEYGGGGHGSMMALGIICEELAKGDAGISLSAGINAGIILQPAVVVQNKAIMDVYSGFL